MAKHQGTGKRLYTKQNKACAIDELMCVDAQYLIISQN
jgi:hypothetical protein